MFFGRQVVHGLHLLLWALDRVAADRATCSIGSIRCSFSEACGINELVTLKAEQTGDTATIEIVSFGRRAARFVVNFQDAPRSQCLLVADEGVPAVRRLETADVPGSIGTIPITLDTTALADIFPALAWGADPMQIATLLATTRLVGMECPGLNSIFTGLKLQFRADADLLVPHMLNYSVNYWNADLRMMKVAVSTPEASGVVEAIVHPENAAQPSVHAIAAHTSPSEFAGEHALIVGGSRGLGETVAKIVAAGGGQVTITYQSGETDAKRVCDELIAIGAICNVNHYDVTAPIDQPVADQPITQIYYFATPRIRPDNALDDTIAELYRASYVAGPARLLDAFSRSIADGVAVYFPSTVFVEYPASGFAIYAQAKLEGEAAARALEVTHSCRVIVDRLPRLKTGQTVALIGDDAADPRPVMFDAVRRTTQLRKEVNS